MGAHERPDRRGELAAGLGATGIFGPWLVLSGGMAAGNVPMIVAAPAVALLAGLAAIVVGVRARRRRRSGAALMGIVLGVISLPVAALFVGYIVVLVEVARAL